MCHSKSLFVGLFLLLSTLGCVNVPTVGSDGLKQEYEQAKNQYEKATKEVENLKKIVEELQQDYDKAQDEIIRRAQERAKSTKNIVPQFVGVPAAEADMLAEAKKDLGRAEARRQTANSKLSQAKKKLEKASTPTENLQRAKEEMKAANKAAEEAEKKVKDTRDAFNKAQEKNIKGAQAEARAGKISRPQLIGIPVKEKEALEAAEEESEDRQRALERAKRNVFFKQQVDEEVQQQIRSRETATYMKEMKERSDLSSKQFMEKIPVNPDLNKEIIDNITKQLPSPSPPSVPDSPPSP